MKTIHAKEIKVRRPLINYEIQCCLGKPLIKSQLHLVDEVEPQAVHAQRIEHELESKRFLPPHQDDETFLDWLHSLDWMIAKRRNEIVWEYSQSRTSSPLIGRLRM